MILDEWVGICQADQREKEKRALGRGGWGLKLGGGSPEICLVWGWLGHGAHSRNMKKGLEQQAEERGLSLEGAMEPGRV